MTKSEIDKISREIIQIRNAVKSKTVELEQKNRELAIEYALERVRVVAMAMKKPEDMLDVCRVVSIELGGLGIKEIRNIQTVIVDEKKAAYLNYEYFRLHKKTTITPIAYKEHKVINRFVRKILKDPEGFFANSLKGSELREWVRYQAQSGQFVDSHLKKAKSLHYYFYSIGPGALGISTYAPLSKEDISLFKRFRNVFQLAYQRFVDIQTAESNTREAEIQLSLERVRARALAMHKSDELTETSSVLFHELNRLGIYPRRSGFGIYEEDNRTIRVWLTTKAEDVIETPVLGSIPLDAHPVIKANYLAWKKKKQFMTHELNGNEVRDYYRKIGSYMSIAPQKKYPARLIFNVYFFSEGSLNIMADEPLSEEQNQVLLRFASVFDLTYRRFLDLQKAERQAREAQIETALERVRGKALAMHNSEELHGVVSTLKKELRGLDIQGVVAATIYLEQDNGSIRVVDLTTGIEEDADQHLKLDKIFWLENTDPKLWIRRMWSEKKKYFVIEADEDDFKRVVSWLNTVDPDEAKIAERIIREHDIKKAWLPTVRLEKGRMNIDLLQPPTPEIEQIMIKLGAGCDLAYRRFLDLQKAEAQTREAKIETALEKVRARAMGMQKSDELQELITTVYSELTKLDLVLDRCFIVIFDPVTRGCTWWMAAPDATAGVVGLFMKCHQAPPYLAHLKAWNEQQAKWQYILEGDVKKEWDEYLFSETEFSLLPQEVIENMKAQQKVFLNASYNAFGCLSLATLQPLTEEQFEVMIRFARVFDLTYTRFNDLKQSEAQTREAKIEAALEKVRSRSLAMHKAEELGEVITVIVEKMKELNFSVKDGVALVTYIEGSKDLLEWMENPGFPSALKFYLPYFEHPVLSNLWKAKEAGKDFAATKYTAEENRSFLYHIFENSDYKHTPQPIKDYSLAANSYANYIAFQKHTSIFINDYSERPLTELEIDILKRFSKVFEQAYIRFLDLQKAEAQTREANIEVALERVRARALAMQEPEELQDVAQVLRTEMGTLGVEELETASIYIHEKDSDVAECWYALKDPTNSTNKMVADHFHLNLDDTWVGREMKKFFLSDEKQTSIVMQGAQRKEWIKYCYKHSPASSGVYGETIPDRTYHLYKFSHGYIGAAAPGDISAESWKLLSRATSVFSLAYSRFKDLTQAQTDLQRLKEEKQRAESALSVLKATQVQLIQSEKMASLGELTAGIAHEIQNPLNFVNNFSEVSNELIAEMKEELSKGNNNAAIQLVEDVKQNLEKINLHGKRADAIVKSMLQHSRRSTGQKEPTDINALADEYLRLAYHGFRAKDQSFTAKFEIRLDDTLEKINVVPQEIGRVILNLVNNAFYAVSEKKQKNLPGYEPMVKLTTRKSNGRTEIKVQDNGNGIPPHVLDKIFQPFFTTKPTGQGTGLGLSLSYDIITKGHGGELNVSTSEGEGSEFVIELPSA